MIEVEGLQLDAESLYQSLLESTGDSVWVVDREGRYLFINEPVARVLGLPREEVLRKTYRDLHPPGETADFLRRVERVFRGEVVRYEYFGLKSGRWFLRTMSPVRAESGELLAVSIFSKDITGRKQMEEMLRESEEKYKDLAESISDVFFAMDSDLRYTYWNKASEKLTGISAEYAIGKILIEVFPDVKGTKVEQFYVDTLKTRQHGSFINRYRLGGKDFVFEIDAYPTKYGISVFVKNITEQKKMEEKLRDYADNLERLVEEKTKEIKFLSNIAASISQAVMVQDNDRKVVFVNKAFEDMYGYRKEEVIGKPTSMLAPEGTADETHREITRGLEARGYWSGEALRKRKNGETFPVWTSVSYLRDEQGEIIGRFGVSTDITERKEMEGRLQRSEERFRRIFDNVPVGIILTDEKGNYVEVNDFQCKSLSKAPREELLRQNYFNERDRTLQPFFRRALQGEMAEHEGWYTTTARGITYWVRNIFTPVFGLSGRVDGVVMLSEDKTERKRLEERLLEQTRLASIGATAAMVGHDIRNPLQAIVNTLYLVKKRYEQMPAPFRELAEEQGLVEQCETIGTQVEYMNKIVSDLQDYARPLKPKPVEASPSQLIDDTLSTISIPENVEVSKMIGEDFPKLMVDPALMRRVFTNLITNAIQAMPNGGRLTIRASKAGEAASITVEDTGVGIPEEYMKKIFQPLFTTKAKGTGFGLAVCKRIVEAHEGSIIVESKVGKGSTFTVKIPLRREVT